MLQLVANREYRAPIALLMAYRRMLFPTRDPEDEDILPPANAYAPFHRMNTQVEKNLKSMVQQEAEQLQSDGVAGKLNCAFSEQAFH
jgi:hypothetical protein